MNEPRANFKIFIEQKGGLSGDNDSSNEIEDAKRNALNKISKKLFQFMVKAMDVVHRADSFAVHKFKKLHRRKWDAYKLDCV